MFDQIESGLTQSGFGVCDKLIINERRSHGIKQSVLVNAEYDKTHLGCYHSFSFILSRLRRTSAAMQVF
ncbi:MAG: hypothetical protein BWY83_02286 [bacterium ADurb.Bin478]|nr:MAG: hypothetical protein BWY83_02286 [bacterium ADurb.Bin478]